MPKFTLIFKGQALSVHHLAEGETLIGRDPGCQIRIESLAVAQRHARITNENEVCRIVTLNPDYPTLLNDSPVEEADLEHGDAVRVGKHVLSFASDGVTLASNTRPTGGKDKSHHQHAYVQILSGEHIGRIIPLNRNMIRLGKSGQDCAIIAHREGGYYLSHLEGDAPAVNGVAIGQESVLLNSGSTIRIGDTELQFYF